MKKQHTDKEKEELLSQVDELKNKYLRALADYQNLEKRVHKERQDLKEHVVEEIMHSVLLFLDEIFRANKNLNNSGLTTAIKGFDATLTYYRIRKIDVLNKEFNPYEMECVEVVKGEKDNEVIEEIRPGYYIGEKVLRPAWVKVSKNKV